MRGKQLLVLLGSLLPLCAADAPLRGRVVDENDAPVASARVHVRLAATSWDAQTDPTGTFTLTLIFDLP